jgi:hypothetical protein
MQLLLNSEETEEYLRWRADKARIGIKPTTTSEVANTTLSQVDIIKELRGTEQIDKPHVNPFEKQAITTTEEQVEEELAIKKRIVKPWTESDVRTLMWCVQGSQSVRQLSHIMEKLGRTADSIKNKARSLGYISVKGEFTKWA